MLPTRWKSAISAWRAIYYIFDTSDGKGYVGSAYGGENLLGRWKTMLPVGTEETAFFGNAILSNFRFTILSESRPTWTRATLFGLKLRGRIGYTPVTHPASMTTRRIECGTCGGRVHREPAVERDTSSRRSGSGVARRLRGRTEAKVAGNGEAGGRRPARRERIRGTAEDAPMRRPGCHAEARRGQGEFDASHAREKCGHGTWLAPLPCS